MKKNRWFVRMVGLLLVSGLMTMTVSLATGVGTEEDPLVTLSYLNERFMEDILKKVDEKIEKRNEKLVEELEGKPAEEGSTTSDTFIVVTLGKGEILTGDIGCEVMLRVGTASCVTPSNPGLIDETSAEILGNDKPLVVNHLYMMTIEGRGVKATADVTKLLVRGTYSIA